MSVPSALGPPCRIENNVRHAHEADQAQQQEQGSNGNRAVHELEPFAERFKGRKFSAPARAVHPHHQQTGDDGDVAHAVGKKAPAFANLRQHQTGHRRTHDPRSIEHGRVERDGVHQIFPAHHIAEERLPRRDVEGIHHAEQSAEHEDMPHVDVS